MACQFLAVWRLQAQKIATICSVYVSLSMISQMCMLTCHWTHLAPTLSCPCLCCLCFLFMSKWMVDWNQVLTILKSHIYWEKRVGIDGAHNQGCVLLPYFTWPIMTVSWTNLTYMCTNWEMIPVHIIGPNYLCGISQKAATKASKLYRSTAWLSQFVLCNA